MALQSVETHYDAQADSYHLQYEREHLMDLAKAYPANYFRLQMLMNAFIEKGIKRVIEVGVGEGTPILNLAEAGLDVSGFDISEKMVQTCRNTLAPLGLPDERIIWGDVEDPMTYASLLRNGQYDGLIAMGVMPHVHNDKQVLRNMRAMIRPGGSVFIEFRNKLFSLFTFNRYTYQFIMEDLLGDVSDEMKNIVSRNLKSRLEMQEPVERLVDEKDESAPGYDAILSKFHNPFEVIEVFDTLGFEQTELLWYHYHPAMPFLSKQDEAAFRAEAMKMEHEASGWRGLFLCSAFVVQAVKGYDD